MSDKKKPASYASHLLRGSFWMIGTRWAMRLVGLVSTMILARLLAPGDFGLIAMVMLAYGLLETISYAGVDLALMRSDNDTREHYDTAWTVQILQGCFITVLLMLSAPLLAAYFKEPRLIPVMLLSAPRALVDGLQNIGIVAFRKELDFAKEFRFTLYNKLLNFLFVVGAAIWFRNYWALVFGTLSASVIAVVLSYVMHPYRPRLSLKKLPQIWSFSQWLMISRIGSFLSHKCDEVIVGGYAGATAMGNYHVASELATLPSNELVMPVRRAMFPTLTRMADKPAEFGRAVLDSFSVIAAICLFVSTCLMAVAPEFVRVVLGEKWLGAVTLIQWLAIFGGFVALVLVLEVPLWVAGKTHLSAIQTWLELAATIPLTWWAVRAFGVEGAAAARTGIAAAMVPTMMLLTARSGSVTFWQLCGALARPALASVVMALLVHHISDFVHLPVIFVLALKIVACLVIFPATLWSSWMLFGKPKGFEAMALERLKALLATRAAGPT